MASCRGSWEIWRLNVKKAIAHKDSWVEAPHIVTFKLSKYTHFQLCIKNFKAIGLGSFEIWRRKVPEKKKDYQ